ncbi:L-gulonolactone oxidase 2-like [Magnolia sinica]|uniref:L-gulonolactone oxidase 2-like n=1 Tax=Magnolia sinica TaxID=86752 RepID=UPI0026595CDD|nr:L-gulonolactone oxidase 2-like [Magnolia sinica]
MQTTTTALYSPSMMPDSRTLQSLIWWYFLFQLLCMVICSPPEDPVQCASKKFNCTITNSYGTFPDRSVCRAGNVVYPTNEEELVAVVAQASMKKRKMKVATRYSHSITKLVCPGGENGLLISTRYLNRTLSVDVSTMLITVESGATLREVIDVAAKSGLVLPYTPYWWGLTIGGLLATGAHGSSLYDKGSSVHDYVVGVRIVTPASASEGYAKVRLLVNSHSDMNAVKVSLGVLGVISQVTLRLQPIFKRSITNIVSNDSDMGVKAVTFGNQHEFGDITWYPSQRKAIYRMDDRISSNASGNGRNDFIGFRSTSTLTLALVRSTEEGQEATSNGDGKCIDSKLTTSTLMTSGYGLMNNGLLFTGYPVVGFHNRLQASGTCLDSIENARLTACPWDPRVKGQFFHQTTITIGLSKVKNFIKDVQKLRDLVPKAMCGLELYNGILIRYVKASSAYLGKQEDGLDFDITYYRSHDPMTPRLYEDIIEEVEQVALFKYGGTPHWGKNRNLAFDGAIKKYDKRLAFLKVKQAYDPSGLFSNEWTDQILGIKGGPSIIKEGCALEGLCICSEDLHCAPKKGYYCRPGKVYTDARVCTRLASSH